MSEVSIFEFYLKFSERVYYLKYPADIRVPIPIAKTN